MISLNGVTLNDSLVWVDEFAYRAISQSIKRVILGNVIVQSMPLTKGNTITISAVSSGDSFTGSFTRAQIIAFKLLEQSGAEVAFVYESFTAQVILQAGGVKVKPLFARPSRVAADLYTGTLVMIEV